MLRPLHRPGDPLPLLTPPQVMTPAHTCSSVGSVSRSRRRIQGAQGRLLNNQRFIQELEQFLAKDIHDACARNSNMRAKLKPSDTKTALIYKRVFVNFL